MEISEHRLTLQPKMVLLLNIQKAAGYGLPKKAIKQAAPLNLLNFKEASIDKNIYSHVWRARFSCKVYFDGLPPKTLQNCEIYGPAFYQ